MFHILKWPGRLAHFFNVLILKNQRLTNVIRPHSYLVNYSSQIALCGAGQNKGFLIINDQSRLIPSRDKYTNKKKKQKPVDEESSDEDDSGEDDDDEFTEKGDSIKTYNAKSLRMDGVLKTLLRVSRKTVETNFYQNRIRVNGQKIQKKSYNVKENDVIEVIKGAGPEPNTLIISQVKIHKIHPDPDKGTVLIKAWVLKSLKVENYRDNNAWKEEQKDEDS